MFFWATREAIAATAMSSSGSPWGSKSQSSWSPRSPKTSGNACHRSPSCPTGPRPERSSWGKKIDVAKECAEEENSPGSLTPGKDEGLSIPPTTFSATWVREQRRVTRETDPRDHGRTGADRSSITNTMSLMVRGLTWRSSLDAALLTLFPARLTAKTDPSQDETDASSEAS